MDTSFVTDANRERYASRKEKLGNLFPSETHFLGEFLPQCESVLDIACASGAISRVMKEINPVLDYTGIDVDEGAIKYGLQRYDDVKLLCGSFPEDCADANAYDGASMFSYFQHILDWKKALMSMSYVAKRYIFVTLSLRLEGATIADRDLSYFYYLDSNVRIPFVVQNLKEIVNFCCTEQVNAQKISIYGYPMTKPSTVYYPIPYREVYKAGLLVELLPEGAAPQKIGGVSAGELDVEASFRPEVSIVLNERKYSFEEDNYID